MIMSTRLLIVVLCTWVVAAGLSPSARQGTPPLAAAIIAEHGSWNRSTASGYRVMAVRTDGRRATGYEPLVDGFLPAGAPGGRGATKAATGRPADVLQMPDGSILISDDCGGRLIRVSYRR
jgi:glucose/arabinose dehydrogenase